MKRLFTFGCSFTQYGWPTWADILGFQFEHYENWGQSGAGNLFISAQISECSIKNTLNKDDTVIVMWTNVTREDRYQNGGWITPGNVYKNTQLFGKDWVKKFADIRGYYVRDFALINLVDELLKSKGVTYYFLSMNDMDIPMDDNTDQCGESMGDIFWHYRKLLKKIRPSVQSVIFNYNENSRPSTVIQRVASPNPINIPKIKFNPKIIRQDGHPTPSEHLEYLEKVLPEITINDDTKKWIHNINELLKDPDFDISTKWKNGKHVVNTRL